MQLIRQKHNIAHVYFQGYSYNKYKEQKTRKNVCRLCIYCFSFLALMFIHLFIIDYCYY
jgi:hypothetical protein